MVFSPHTGPPRAEIRAFLDDMRDHPDDDTPRLILADWLQDQPNPDDRARGEFIRLQCLLAQDRQAEDLRRREAYLLRFHVTEWLGPLQRLAQQWAFRRGLVHLVMPGNTCFLPDLHARPGTEGWAWVEGLTFVSLVGGAIPPLIQRPLLAGIRSLTLQESRLGNAGLELLCTTSHMGQLAELHLGMNRIGDAGVEALAAAGAMPNLRVLDLTSNQVTGRGLAALARATNLKRLRSLDLSFTDITNADMAVLSGSELLAGLEVLELRGNRRIGTEGLTTLVSCDEAVGLRVLDLGQTLLRSEVVRILARAPQMRGLRRLHLERSRLFDEAVKFLAFEDGLPNLEELYLGRNHLTDAGAVALTQTPVNRPWRALYLDGNHLGSESAEALANWSALSGLRELSLDDNHIGDAGALALASSPYLDRLTFLDVGRNGLSAAGKGVLLRRFGRGVVMV